MLYSGEFVWLNDASWLSTADNTPISKPPYLPVSLLAATGCAMRRV